MGDIAYLRPDGRGEHELREIFVNRGFNKWAEGSMMLHLGSTVVHCTATVDDKVPPFLRGSGSGWVTAEYSMLPRATETRGMRDASRGKLNGRSSEIQRLIGRSLRAAVDLTALGERTITIDCDVLQADGGTRTTSITAGFVCLVDALRSIGMFDALKAQVASVSVGVVNGAKILDLCYDEDRIAEVDCNVVMTSAGDIVEIQGTGEGGVFSRDDLDEMLSLADAGISVLLEMQQDVLELTPHEQEIFRSFIGPF